MDLVMEETEQNAEKNGYPVANPERQLLPRQQSPREQQSPSQKIAENLRFASRWQAGLNILTIYQG
jgi:hypothetical protein